MSFCYYRYHDCRNCIFGINLNCFNNNNTIIIIIIVIIIIIFDISNKIGTLSIIITLIIGLFHSCTISNSRQTVLALICSSTAVQRAFINSITSFASQVPIETWLRKNNLNSCLAQVAYIYTLEL